LAIGAAGIKTKMLFVVKITEARLGCGRNINGVVAVPDIFHEASIRTNPPMPLKNSNARMNVIVSAG
jgi:hypothetical protein